MLTINKTGETTGGMAENLIADGAGNNGLGVTENGSNVEAA